MDRSIPTNQEGADAVIASVSNPITKDLVRLALAAARMRFVRQVGQSEEDWQKQLPTAAFDIGFFAEVAAEVFSQTETLRALLEGKSIAEATGWDD